MEHFTTQNLKLPADIDWSPLKGGGTNFRTHRLVVVDSEIVEFKPTGWAKAFCWIFFGVGVVTLALGVGAAVNSGFRLGVESLVPTLFGLVFGGIGLVLFRFLARPVVFDRRRDYYWKGRKDPDEYWDKRELSDFAELSDIVGLQTIGEVVSSDSGSFTSYELNLVLKDGSRLNVIDHGNVDALKEDALQLSDFLGVPILDYDSGRGSHDVKPRTSE